jgi:hypothetical protein
VNSVHIQLRQLEATALARRDADSPADDSCIAAAAVRSADDDGDRRRTLTSERVVAEALTIISSHGVDVLSMRALATGLGVVPSWL